VKYLIKNKSPSAKAKGLGVSKLPQQNDFRNFCMEDNEYMLKNIKELIF